MIRAAALALAALVASGGAAAEVCLLPLENGAPVNEVEREQPYRIIYGSGTIPGFPFVLAAPLNRARPDQQLYTVRGMRFEELGAEFPRGALWTSQVTPPRADGSVYGWALLRSSLFRLAAGADEFRPVEAAEGALRFSYDVLLDRLYVQGRDLRLNHLEDDRLEPSPLGGLGVPAPGYSPTATLPRFLPPLAGYLAAEEDGRLWFRPESGDWRRVAHGEPIHDAWRVEAAGWHHDPDAGTVTLFFGGLALVLDARPGHEAAVLVEVAVDVAVGVPGGPVIAWEHGGVPGWAARWLGGNDKVRNPPRLVLVTREGAVVPPGEPVESGYLTDERGVESGLPHAFLMPLPEFGTVLIGHPAGFSALLDGRVVPQPQLAPDRVGRWTHVVRFSNRLFLQSELGLYKVAPDLSVTPRPWPDTGFGYWKVTASAAFGGALVQTAPEGRLWVTADGRDFEEVRNLTGAPLWAVGSDLPGRRAVLAATGDGAALVAECP